MPEIDMSWAPCMSYHHSDGDKIYIAVTAMRLAELSLELGLSAAEKLAIEKSLGFCDTLQITNDFLTFAQFLAHLPLVIHKGDSFPTFNFMESPLADPTYFTANTDYFLYCVEQRPRLKVETGYDVFPPKLWAHLVISALVVYRSAGKFKRKPLQYDWHRFSTAEGWTCDFPPESSIGAISDEICSQEYVVGLPFSYTLFPRYAWSFAGLGFADDDNIYHALWSHGIKKRPDGEIYYWGTNDSRYSDYWPYKRVLPHPEGGFGIKDEHGTGYFVVSIGQLGSIDGSIATYYPPYVQDEEPSVIRIGKGRPGEGAPEDSGRGKGRMAIKVIRNFGYSYGQPSMENLDGSWRIGFGGGRIV